MQESAEVFKGRGECGIDKRHEMLQVGGLGVDFLYLLGGNIGRVARDAGEEQQQVVLQRLVGLQGVKRKCPVRMDGGLVEAPVCAGNLVLDAYVFAQDVAFDADCFGGEMLGSK